MKRVKLKRSLTCCLITFFVLLFSGAVGFSAKSALVSFQEILKSNNITIIGDDALFTEFQCKGLVRSFVATDNTDSADLIQKLTQNKSQTVLTPAEIVEAEYYMMDKENQINFLKDTRGQEIVVQTTKSGAICMSYNPNF